MKDHIIYYSNYCETSKRLIQTLHGRVDPGSCDFICVDYPSSNVPPMIQYVPTIVMPRQSTVLAGDETIQWASQQSSHAQQRPQVSSRQADASARHAQPQPQAQVSHQEPNRERHGGEGYHQKQIYHMDQAGSGKNEVDQLAWLPGEMNGAYSTSYSFVETDTSAQGNGGSTLPGSFSFVGADAGGASNSGSSSMQPMTQTIEKKSRIHSDFDQRYEEFQRQREVGVQMARPRI